MGPMAFGVSRTYLSLAATASSRFSTPVIYLRSYASAAAVATIKNRLPAATRSAATKAAKSAASGQQVLTQAEQMEQLDRILSASQNMPTTDVWGQKVETLDVMIPYNIIATRHRLSGLRGMWSQFWKNRRNDMKNTVCLITLASNNAIPGVDTSRDGFFKKLWKWPRYIFGTLSVKPTSWLALTRNIALDTYQSLNTATAKNDLKGIKRLTIDEYLTDVLATQKKRIRNYSYIWRFHREVNPTQIVSLRVIEGYLAPEDPKFGNRLMVHALVKFDTEQSLEVYDRQGMPLHKLVPGVPKKTVDGTAPAEKKRVVQYLVLEKRMWYDGPWLIREQIWESAPKKS